MLHIAKFYTKLNNEDIHLLSAKYQQAITLTDYEINKSYNEREIIVTISRMKFGVWYMFVLVDFIILLNKTYITESDRWLIEEKVSSFLIEVFGTRNRELILIRIDYRFDAFVKDEQARKLLFRIYKKTTEKYRFQRKYDMYDKLNPIVQLYCQFYYQPYLKIIHGIGKGYISTQHLINYSSLISLFIRKMKNRKKGKVKEKRA